MPDESRPPRNPLDPVRVFYVRADEDEDLCEELDKHLALHRRPSLIKKRPALLETWNPGSVTAGNEREEEVKKRLAQAELAVTFISRDLWISKRYKDLERALELRADGRLRLVPIVARPVLPDHDLSELAALPRRGPPLDKQPNRDQAFVDIAQEIVALAQAIQGQGTALLDPGATLQKGAFAEARRKETIYSGPAPQIDLSGSQRPLVKGDARVREGLERVVRATNEFLDIDEWYARLGRVRRRVCKIRLPRTWGTGFLIGPDLVLTNHHVVESLLDQPRDAAHVSVIFDDAVAAVGSVAAGSRTCTLQSSDWLVDESPDSEPGEDGQVDPEKIKPDELDHAVLRLAQSPGHDDMGESRVRGWLEGKPFPFLPGSPLFIVQHPRGGPMKLALDTDAVVRLADNGLRVMYRTNTDPGSSGAPCFNQQWELVALHHHGADEQNQGIPIMKILERLAAKGVKLPPSPS